MTADQNVSHSAISIAELSKSFGETKAVNGITLSVPAGTFYGVCGPNGAGKTTLLRILTGMLAPDSGTVCVRGVDVWKDPVEAKRTFGFVADNPRLFDRLTARECMEYIGALRGMDPDVIASRTDALLTAVDLTGQPRTLLADYSLGMTKRIGLATALLHNPAVLILDEPFGALDPVNAQVMEQMLAQYRASGGTVLFSSHVMDVVERLCDHVAIVVAGSVAANGTVKDVSRGERLQQRFVELVGGRELDGEELSWLGSSSG